LLSFMFQPFYSVPPGLKFGQGSVQVGTGVDNIADAVYPIGSIYMSVNPTEPGALFGGTFTRPC